jgi:Tol biopolymer transport system component
MNSQEPRSESRLESWKEIGAYLQRDSTTARRWEKEEGLPVHRHSHKSRSSVYAYPAEIDTWRASRKVVPEPAPARPLWKIPAFALTLALCLVMVGNGVRPVSAQQSQTITARQLWTDSGDEEASITPDGRYFATTDWTSGDLMIRDLSTNQSKRLLAKSGGWEQAAYATSPVLSPDLRQVAFQWYHNTSNDIKADLRVMPNEPGAKSRVLTANPEFGYFRASAWSRDGKSILATIWKTDRTAQLAWISATDGSVTVLKSLEWRNPNSSRSAQLSPDGRFIAYSALEHSGSSSSRVYVLSADGSKEEEVVSGSGVNEAPFWSADGRRLVFTSDRSGSFGVWSVPVENGRAAGAPTLLKADVGRTEPIGLSRSGSYYYLHTQGGQDVFLANLDPDGRVRGDSSRLTDNFVGSNRSPAWSPDGKSIAFQRARLDGRGYDLVIRTLENGAERTYGEKVLPIVQVEWFADGKSLLVPTRDDQNSFSVYRLNAADGRFTKLIAGPGKPERMVLSPDQKTLYRSDRPAGKIVTYDLSSGRETTVFTLPGKGGLIFSLAVSPDGRSLAFNSIERDPGDLAHEKAGLYRVGVDGTGVQVLYTTAIDELNGTAGVQTWTKDGRYILFNTLTSAQGQPQQWRLMRIRTEGGQPEPTGLKGTGPFHQFVISPDGRRIAYGDGPAAVREVWALDNALAALK